MKSVNEQQFDAPVDPQQSWREYATPRPWAPPRVASPPPPSTPTAVYPAGPAYPGQAPGQPHPAYPGYPGYGAPVYAPYPGYNLPAYGYPGYGVPAYGYPGYGYYAQPPRPKRDRYLLVMAIVGFACSILALLGGLFSLLLLFGVSIKPSPDLTPAELFTSQMLFLALAMVGIVGGGFCLYHSIRSLFLRKPSKHVWLPGFWTFLLVYLGLLWFGYWQSTQGTALASLPFTGLLIFLAALLPALAILALGLRRLRFSARNQWLSFWHFILRKPRVSVNMARSGQWPTTWRRLVLALVSGALFSSILASILNYIIPLIFAGDQGATLLNAVANPGKSISIDPSLYGLLLIILSVVAPLVEETVKPLAVVMLIGRLRSKAEAFALGLACGIGFDLIETTQYISSGYEDWLHVALIRSGAGLLHGLGAAMVALGWYILTHKSEGRWPKRILLALGCVLYAILQHAIWNGSWGLILLPSPLGDFFQTWTWTIGQFTLDASMLVNIVEMIWMIVFFIFIAGRLRTKPAKMAEQNVAA